MECNNICPSRTKVRPTTEETSQVIADQIRAHQRPRYRARVALRRCHGSLPVCVVKEREMIHELFEKLSLT